MSENMAEVLDACLAQMAQGTGAVECLARYPQQAADLDPLLAAAQELRALHTHKMPAAQWLRVQAALSAARTAQAVSRRSDLDERRPAKDAPPSVFNVGPLRLLRDPARPAHHAGRVAATVLALLLVLSATAVAAGGPGAWTYDLRLAAERIPVYLAITPLSRGTAELRYADRRLSDVRSHLIATGHVDPTALEALLARDADAAELAQGLTSEERSQVAAWIAGHAGCLQVLSRTARGERSAETLARAAERARLIAEQARGQAPAGSKTPGAL